MFSDLKLILTMDPEYSQDVVRCHLCEEPNPNTHCYICEKHLCNDCEGKHLLDESKEHRFVLFKQRKNITPCQKHPSKKCDRFCEECVIPVCEQCVSSREHSGHELVDVVEKLESKKEVLKNDLQDLQEIILPIYKDIENDILIQRNNLKEKIAQLQEDIKKHGEYLNSVIKKMISDLGKIDFSSLANVQSLEDNTEHIISEINESICELNEILNSNDVSLVSAYESRNAEFKRLPPKFTIILPCFTPKQICEEQIGSLSAFSYKTEERGYISLPEKSLIDEPRIFSTIDTEYPSSNELLGVSCLSDEKVWTRGFNYKIMKLYNLKGDLLQHIETKSGNASHDIAVTMNGDLIYTDIVDRSVNIVKKTQIERIIQLLEWKPLNVCTSLSGDILVVMINDDKQAKVVRYSGSKEKQTIQYKGNGQPLYSCSNFKKHICENRNRDICVSDFSESKVVVVNQTGNFVAEYTGQPSTPKGAFKPYGITTDSECRILITDWGENAVYVLDQHGQFLRYIKNRFCDFNIPCGLCFGTSGKLFVAESNTGKVKKIQYCL